MSDFVRKNSTFQDITTRMGVVGELMGFLWKRKLFWLIPMLLLLVIFAVIIVLGNAGPISFAIYPFF